MKKEIDDTTLKDKRNPFRLEKEINLKWNNRDIRNLFEHEYYYKPTRVGNFWSNNYIEYESNSGRNKKLSVEKYLNKIRPYLSDM